MPTVSIETIQKNLDADRRFRERRHSQWTDNYLLYRDTVITNRLTQRQSVNVPLMKETIRTQLARVDQAPTSTSKTSRAMTSASSSLTLTSTLEGHVREEPPRAARHHRQEAGDAYCRSFWKLNIVDGTLRLEILDPQDVLVDRYVNPWDLESARRIAHIGIFRSLSDLELNEMYDKEAFYELRTFFQSPLGVQKSNETAQAIVDRNQRLESMGVPDMQDPVLGETYVELNVIQMKVWDETAKEDVVMVVVVANGNQILRQKPLRDILGINEYTYVTWADDATWRTALATIHILRANSQARTPAGQPAGRQRSASRAFGGGQTKAVSPCTLKAAAMKTFASRR